MKFQVVLFSDGRIGLNYIVLDSYPAYNGLNPDGDTTVYKTGGINATVGIWKGLADSITLPAGKFVPGPHIIRGDSQGAGFGESNDSYVRMAWDTGGSAWDIRIVPQFGITSDVSNSLRDQFITSLASQINVAAMAAKVARADDVLQSIDFGATSVSTGANGFTGDATGRVTTTTLIDLTSNSVPVVGTTAGMQAVFQTARATTAGTDIVLDYPSLANGTYIVELFFAPITTLANTGIFDIEIEGKTLLNNYQVSSDRGRVVEFLDNGVPSATELDMAVLGPISAPAATVKRFQVNVSSADGTAGLRILLEAESGSPFINALRILRAELPGDYNRNGTVDAADYNVWRDSLGRTVVAYSGADGNGDGMVTVTDFAVWKSNFTVPLGGSGASVPGDYNADQIVNQADRDLWQSLFGSTADLRADGNFNGIVDLADLEVWQEMLGVTTLDSLADFGDLNGDFVVDSADFAISQTPTEKALVQANFGTVRADVFPLVTHGTDGMPLDILGAAPVVVGVTVGTSDFAATVGSGEQLRSITAASPNSISIRFSEEVLATSDALAVINLDGTSPGAPTSFTYNLYTQTATWTFAAMLADGRYLVRLSDSVFDLSHDALDGEFTNPWTLAATGTSVFPSGDGTAGGEFRYRFTVLAADTDHDNVSGSINYVNWKSYEPGMIYVSTTADDYDADLSFGDVSLREAVNYANTVSEPTTIQVPAGRYTLSRIGTESTSSVALNDLNILAEMTILGAGPGVTIIDNSGLATAPGARARAFDLASSASKLRLARLTVANGSSQAMAQAAQVTNGATLEIIESAIVNHTAYAGAAGILVNSANLVVERSVFTNIDNTSIYGGTAIYLVGYSSITVGESIFALNTQPTFSGGTARLSISAGSTTTKINKGHNLYDYAGGGFFDTTPGTGDYLGTPSYVVTSVADTFNHADDLEALSLREAVDLANTASGTQEIWLPAWHFTLTLDRGSHTTDTDTAYGDLDVKDSLKVRGVAGRTSVDWKAGIVDKVFELLGDSNHDGQADFGNVSSADYTLWQDQNGHSGNYGEFSADFDDDGDVDHDDYDLWAQNFGHTLQLADIVE